MKEWYRRTKSRDYPPPKPEFITRGKVVAALWFLWGLGAFALGFVIGKFVF